jgi:demethylmenaquinone methyltransferase/2-methoxy-6-polyprenyl-1,4-benzoquinol methylase
MQPHPILTQHYSGSSEKQDFLNTLFNRGASSYDRICGLGFFGTGLWYRKMSLQRAGLRKGMKLLDVAAGTGLVTRAAAELLQGSKDIVCVDPSTGMLAAARKNLSCTMLQGVADDLPVGDAEFDFLSMGYALRHVESLQTTFKEYRRVLKPGGKLLILEVSKPSSAPGQALAKLYFGRIVPLIARLLMSSPDAEKMMSYYWETIDQCVAPRLILQELAQAGFVKVKRTVQLGVFSEYTAGKI